MESGIFSAHHWLLGESAVFAVQLHFNKGSQHMVPTGRFATVVKHRHSHLASVNLLLHVSVKKLGSQTRVPRAHMKRGRAAA